MGCVGEFLKNEQEISKSQLHGRTCGTRKCKKKQGSKNGFKRMSMPTAWGEFSLFLILLPILV